MEAANLEAVNMAGGTMGSQTPFIGALVIVRM